MKSMTPRAWPIVLCVFLLAAMTAAQTSAAPVSPSASKVSAKLATCVSSPTVAERVVEFSGTMNQIAGADTMQMRFHLLSRANGKKRFRSVTGAGLDEWKTSSVPDATVLTHSLSLQGVETAISYKSVVRFRWLDSAGKKIASATRTTKSCRQTAKLPDLSVSSLESFAKVDGSGASYVANVANTGGSEARDFEVRVTLNGVVVGSQTVESLAADSTIAVSISGPACAGTMAAEVDRDNHVRELNGKNNTISVACPAAK